MDIINYIIKKNKGFKVGDIVKIVGKEGYCDRHNIGDIVKIEMLRDKPIDYLCTNIEYCTKTSKDKCVMFKAAGARRAAWICYYEIELID